MRIQILSLVFALTCGRASAATDIVTELCGSPQNREIIAHADRVVACAMPVDWKFARPQGGGVVFPEGPFIVVPSDVADRVRIMLLAADSYRVGGEEKDCSPDYHIRIRFSKGERSLDVDFCFGCDILLYHHGREVFGEEDFDPVSDRLFAEFFALFPDDPSMVMLQKQREIWKAKREKAANQALQPTSMTRSVRDKSPVSGRLLRGG